MIKKTLLNFPLFKTLIDYSKTKKRLSQDTIEKTLDLFDKLILYSSIKTEFNIPADYHSFKFRYYKQVIDLLMANGYLEIKFKEHRNLTIYSFTEKYITYQRFYEYSNEEVFCFLRNSKATNIMLCEMECLNSIKSIHTNNKKPNLNLKERKGTFLSGSIKKDLRKDIKINNEDMVEIDICTATFSLSNTFILKNVNSEFEKEGIRNIKDIYQTIGDIYNIDRKIIKENFMSFFYSSNNGQHTNIKKEINEFFEINYPEYYIELKRLRKLKRENPLETIVKQYMKLEMITTDNICKKFLEKNISMVTNYDAFFVQESNLKIAEEIILSVLGELDNKIAIKSENIVEKPKEIINEKPIKIVISSKEIEDNFLKSVTIPMKVKEDSLDKMLKDKSFIKRKGRLKIKDRNKPKFDKEYIKSVFG